MAEKTHITETPDTSHIKNIDVTHEVSDVYVGGIAKFTVGLVVLMIASFLIVWGMFRALNSRITEPPRSPMALSEKDRLPPEPRLQGAPGFAEELEKVFEPSVTVAVGFCHKEADVVSGTTAHFGRFVREDPFRSLEDELGPLHAGTSHTGACA